MATDIGASHLGRCPNCGTPTPADQSVMKAFIGYKEDYDFICQVICTRCGSHLLAEENRDDDKTADQLAWRVKPDDGVSYHPSPTDRPS